MKVFGVLTDGEEGHEGNGFPKPKIYALISSYHPHVNLLLPISSLFFPSNKGPMNQYQIQRISVSPSSYWLLLFISCAMKVNMLVVQH